MGKGVWIDELSDVLFWDVERKSLDSQKHIRWIIERVLEKGNYSDWLALKTNVTKETLEKEFNRLRIDPKSRNFLRRYLHGTDQLSR
ncbi:MAG: hypothetical protein U5P10_17045 [Spirochaetia bacterium]|nr:hypothetical protein [Spirochaetia bacterium]